MDENPLLYLLPPEAALVEEVLAGIPAGAAQAGQIGSIMMDGGWKDLILIES